MVQPDQRGLMAKPVLNDLLKRIKTENLYPPFLEKVKATLQECLESNQVYYITSGERTWDEQQALYNKGRVPVDTGRHVTNAKPGYSGHNFAIAVDCCHDLDINKEGLQPDYTDKAYKTLAESAQNQNLTAGYFWTKAKEGIHDPPHIQLNIKEKGINFAKLRSIYEKGGKIAVFKYLDKFNW